MATKNLTSSAAIGTSGGEIRVQRITFSGSHATNIGNATLKTGGTSGTVQWGPFYVGPGETVQVDVPYVKADYVTLADANAMVEFLTGRTG